MKDSLPSWNSALGVWSSEKAEGVEESELPDPLWIFGYGSLCFSPGLMSGSEYSDGFIEGYTRRFWQLSCDHRGTSENPGLVCTLLSDTEWNQNNHGSEDQFSTGKVYGRAYRIDKDKTQSILDELDYREKGGYSRSIVDVHLTREGGTHLNSPVKALLYKANSDNPNFLNNPIVRASIDKQADIIRMAVGPSGVNIDYLLRYHEYLQSIGQVDSYMNALVEAV